MKRLRMIAGPNGSGKTSLTNYLRSLPHLDFGYYINADDLQAALVKASALRFADFDLATEEKIFREFYNAHPLFQQCEGTEFTIASNVLHLTGAVPRAGYSAALIADFIRQQMLVQGVSFSFETVMSDPGKVELLKTAKKAGYRVYLYFVNTVDPSVNIERVADRVRKSGHDVPVDKIVSRYHRSLSLLWHALEFSDRAYVFDNSGEAPELVLEMTPDRKAIININLLPDWVRQYVLSKI